MDFIAAHNMTFAAARQRDGGNHNRRETPLFAASIQRKALQGVAQNLSIARKKACQAPKGNNCLILNSLSLKVVTPKFAKLNKEGMARGHAFSCSTS